MEETKKKKTSVKKVLGAFLALVLVAVISIIGTLAFLSDKADTPLTNVFTGSSDISITLTEPTWTSTGEAKATQYTPGLTIEKDPKITNTTTNPNDGGDYSEWVAMRVDYTKSKTAVTYSDLIGTTSTCVISSLGKSGIYSADNSTGKWYKVIAATDSRCKFDIYVYKTRLETTTGSNTTDALFEKVTINKDIVKDNGASKYPSFTITVNAAAIKNEKQFGTTDASGNYTAKESIVNSNLTYVSPDKSSNDYVIMNELVKLLLDTTSEKDEYDSKTEYQEFTGLNTDGTAYSTTP